MTSLYDKAYIPDYGDLSPEEKAELAECGRKFETKEFTERCIPVTTLTSLDLLMVFYPAFQTSDYGRCEGETT